ncbi:unnamed protein product [Strongylus vulgaris]|uniref:Uncharacterized protein n=1 Tax=Strongylus vulgaris TaxID=40348 RepID=A0A3P7KHH9_STRVU|nr:unnamed protein product [Strongylus vulgaris]
MRIDKMENRCGYDKPTPPMFLDGNFTNDECTITSSHLPHVRLPGLYFLQGDYVVVDAPCSFEKGVEIGVGGDCPGVVGAEHETISMASG